MKNKEESIKPPKDGALAIALIGQSEEIMDQEILLIQDADDRFGDEIRRFGLPGGGIENSDKTIIKAIQREFEEEVGIRYKIILFKKFGCYSKKRENNFINENHLFVIKLNFLPEQQFCTNDTSEVSDIRVFKLKEIINLAKSGLVHEGSIRLIFLYLLGKKKGSLNEPVEWNGFVF